MLEVDGLVFDPTTTIPGFANGGSVGANRPYLVGERGPELFVPSNSGTIRSAETMGSYMPSNQTVAVNQPTR